MMTRIWLDAASGQPLSPAAAASLLPAATATWPVPVGVHSEASRARAIRDAAVEQLAAAWGVSREAVAPVNGLAQAFFHAVDAITEPVAVTAAARQSQIAAAKTPPLPVDQDGRALIDGLPESGWLAVQAGNSELGTIEDFAAIRLARPNLRLLVDATEWIGRLPGLPTGDVLVARASAWAGPATAAFVIDRTGEMPVGIRKRQMLAPDPVMLVAAAEAWSDLGDIGTRADHQAALLSWLTAELDAIPGVRVHRVAGSRLPHVLAFSASGLAAEQVAVGLDQLGYGLGAGSACISDGVEPSHVLKATGRGDGETLRIGLPIEWDEVGLRAFPAALNTVIKDLGGY